MDAKILPFLEQIIEKAEQDDLEWKAAMLKANKAQHAIGESWMIHHLKALKELLEKEK